MNIARKWNTFKNDPYVSAKNHDKKLISKQQVAQLFNVSMHTIDCWLHDGKLPEPKRTFPRQKWDYKELVVRTRLSQKIGSYSQKIRFTSSPKSQQI
jgi:predicted DNA-binding transcriptional regulator AlpA